MNKKILYVVLIIGVIVLGGMVNSGCKKTDEEAPVYVLTVESVRDLVTNESRSWPATITTSNGSVVRLNSGESTTIDTGVDGKEVDITVDGGSRDILQVKLGPNPEDFFPSVLAYSTDNQPLHLNLVELSGKNGGSSNLYLVLYKIDPKSINLSWAREALTNRAVYEKKSITAYPVNDGYSQAEFDKYRKGLVKQNLDNIISQLNTLFNGYMTIRYDPNATSGDIAVYLSPDYYNPGHGEHISNGVISDSVIKIRGDTPGSVVLEEFYQSLGVRHDIGSSIRDEIADNTLILNPFGKKLMMFNYRLAVGFTTNY